MVERKKVEKKVMIPPMQSSSHLSTPRVDVHFASSKDIFDRPLVSLVSRLVELIVFRHAPKPTKAA